MTVQLSPVQMWDVARRNVESNIGCCDPGEDVMENVYVLAFDALVDAGVEAEVARGVATAFVAEMAEG